MEEITYNKPAIDVDKQIELLKSRNLIISDIDYAKTILSNITYYRLSSYMKFFQKDDKLTFFHLCLKTTKVAFFWIHFSVI